MHHPTQTGRNRTGTAASPLDSKKTMEGALQAPPTRAGDGQLFEKERIAWCESADPVGTMPIPASVKGALETTIGAMKGEKLNVLLDKLGARLAFERTGTRLYQALISKFEAAHIHQGGPSRQELEQIRDEERAHLQLVEHAIKELGGDPTAVTPSADVSGVASMGLVQVMADPRSTFTQCLEVVLMAELLDNDAWTSLAELTSDMGFDDIAIEFRQALEDEEAHLAAVRTWLSAAVRGQAGLEPAVPAE